MCTPAGTIDTFQHGMIEMKANWSAEGEIPHVHCLGGAYAEIGYIPRVLLDAEEC
jgi:hypothetical protein